jgi:hypothetical protein
MDTLRLLFIGLLLRAASAALAVHDHSRDIVIRALPMAMPCRFPRKLTNVLVQRDWSVAN